MVMGGLRGPDGGLAATPLVSAAPASGIVAGLIAAAIALGVGLFAAKFLGLGPGMTAAGLVLAWAAWKTGTVEGLVRSAQSSQPLKVLALEGLLFGLVAVVITAALGFFAKRDAHHDHAHAGTSKYTVAMGPAIGAALVAGAVVAWLLAVSPLKGQAIAAAIAAATIASAAARLVDFKAPMPALIIPVVALAILGPLTGVAMAGHAGVVTRVYDGSLFPIANITPLDWIAGGLLGIPLGVAWAGSMIEKHGTP
jgi:hypothetical protein